jgi:hypothetical protein
VLPESSPFDPLAYGAAGLVMATAGLMAVAAPAARSSAVDPLKALRAD